MRISSRQAVEQLLHSFSDQKVEVTFGDVWAPYTLYTLCFVSVLYIYISVCVRVYSIVCVCDTCFSGFPTGLHVQ